MRTDLIAITNLPVRFERTSPSRRAREVWARGLFISGGSAITAGLFGLIFSFGSLFGLASSRLSLAGTILTAAMFPLLVLAAHCLDKSGDAHWQIRLEYCRQNGLPDEER